MKSFIAHTKNRSGEEHCLRDHLIKVSDIICTFTDEPSFQRIFKVAGLLHDLGKYQPAFQRYLIQGGPRGSVPHASWGAALARQVGQNEAAFVIDGHHKGLPDKADLKDSTDGILDANSELFITVKKAFLNDLQLTEEELSGPFLKMSILERELFIRYLFSALTDADWLDTEKHFNNELSEIRKVNTLNADLLIEKVDKAISSKNKEGEINRIRNQVREYAVEKSNGEVGFYSITLPTGMGKTLASLSWALHHARHNGLKRVIIVLPFISIIDQTANELKELFGEGYVLEHHSGFNEDEEIHSLIASEQVADGKSERRLATENWDYPIIVTTTVQFFESLFANRPSKCRKVHNIANSVVIFDEVQTLPKELVLPTLSMLKNVHSVMNVSFLFCTATQPAFGKTEKFDGIENIIPLVANPEEIFDKTQRVIYRSINNYDPVELCELKRIILESGLTALVIFNTKKQTLQFYKEIREYEAYTSYHLSTSMYPIHRKETIKKIKSALKKGEKILVVSTQLIEAGVDFDFPSVYREIAPLESIIQSAGRCNREGKMQQPGIVNIFSLRDRPGPMRQYYSLGEFANSLYKSNEEILSSHNFFGEYYSKVFSLFIPDDKYSIEQNRKDFSFKRIAETYRLIDSPTTPVFILCNASRDLYNRICHKPELSRDDYRAMQQFSVQVYDNFLKENIDKLGKALQGYWIWHGDYNVEYGINTNQPIMIL